MLVDYCLNVCSRMMQKISSMSFMKENVEATSTGNQLLTKSLEMAITGPPSFRMSIK